MYAESSLAWISRKKFLCIERLLCPSVTNINLGATFPGANMVQGKTTLGYLRTRTFYTRYTVCVSLICLILIDLSSTFKFYDYNRNARNIVTFPKYNL
jgi:hypothetical protein